MLLEANKQIVVRVLEEGIGRGEFEVLGDLLSENLIFHMAGVDHTGAEGWKNYVSEWRAGFPDLNVKSTLTMAEGDLVIAAWSSTGTHSGVFRDQAPTGNVMKASGIDLYELKDGRIVEIWDQAAVFGWPYLFELKS